MSQISLCAAFGPSHGLPRFPAAIAVAAFLAFSPALADDANVTVKIANFTFAPNEITVSPGTTVTWVNEDDIPHTATSATGAFHSKALDTDDSFSHVFITTGEFTYFCALHPHMTGKVIVKAAKP